MRTRLLGQRAFTLIELLVVLAIVATLLTIAAPRYFGSVDRAKESALKQNLYLMREAIDKHKADTGQYPASLATLVEKRYLRQLPADPMTESIETWVVLPPPQQPDEKTVYDVKSGASGTARDGTAYASW
jgi:general secretion pathway protein G